jgi:hypothetical protein
VEEARENLEEAEQKSRLNRLLYNVELFDSAPREIIGGIRLPEKDVPIPLGAIGAKATHLINRQSGLTPTGRSAFLGSLPAP